MVALVQPESSRDSGEPTKIHLQHSKNNHLEIAEICADPQITSTQPAARHEPARSKRMRTRFERKEKGKDKIQHPGIKRLTDFKRHNTTEEGKKERNKNVFFGSYCTRRATTECFSSLSR